MFGRHPSREVVERLPPSPPQGAAPDGITETSRDAAASYRSEDPHAELLVLTLRWRRCSDARGMLLGGSFCLCWNALWIGSLIAAVRLDSLGPWPFLVLLGGFALLGALMLYQTT